MSKEQDNQMEQWLEEYAQRRRNELDEPIEMHEATRTMLQGEVSRVYAKPVATQPEPQGSSAWLAWAIGGATVGVAAIVITYVSNLSQDQNPVVMAKADEEQSAAAGERGRVGEAEKDSADSVSKFKETGETQTVTIRDNEERNAPARRIAPTVAPAGNKDNPGASGSVKGSPVGAPIETTHAATSNHTAPKKALVGGFAPRKVNVQKRDATFYKDIRELRQDFAQSNLPVANRKNVLPEAVLVDFQVERTGNQVRVIDQDGSVYTGNVINEEQYSSVTEDKAFPAKLSAANGRAEVADAPRAPIATVRAQRNRVASSGQFYFRVQGFNRTLRKEVVLEATLDSPPEKTVATGKLIALKSKVRARENEQLKTAEVDEVKKELSDQSLQAVGNLQIMRVLGNARIEKANYAVDAYLQQPTLPAKAMIKPTQAREK